MARNDEDEVERFVVREPAREVTFRAVVLVVVILLLTNLLIIVYFVSPYFNPDEGTVTPEPPEEDWLLPEEPRDITTDESWIGQDSFLERPLVVKDGANLRIVDSHIRVYLEDLLFWLRPAIQVEPGATLTLVDSTLEVFQDPRLEASVVGAYQRPDHMIPYIARVVNLDNAIDPVFHMDVSYLGNATPVAVGVLPGVDEDLVLLDILDPTTTERHQWHHVDVSLAEYAGTTPWVVVWFESYPEGVTFVGNLSVTDGDGWPEGDAFPTGHPVKDGWAVSPFETIPTIQRKDFSRGVWDGLQNSWQPLIEGWADVTIQGSEIQEPAGMGRKASAGFYKEVIDPDRKLRSDEAGAHGGHIKMVMANLAIDRSIISNVPVTGFDITVDAETTTFQGDHDLVSLHSSSGTFDDCRFITDTLAPDNPFNSYNYRYVWALAIEDNYQQSPVDVKKCEFRDNPMAIDLSYAYVKLEKNTFMHISRMVVWNHMSRGFGSYTDMELTNTIEDAGENIYLESSATEISFFHPGWNDSDIQVHSGAPLRTGLDLYSPFSGNLKSFYGRSVRYIVPLFLVKASGQFQFTKEVKAEVTWEGKSGRFTFDPDDPDLILDLSQILDEETNGTVSVAHPELYDLIPTALSDVYQLTVHLGHADRLYLLEPVMRFEIDNVTVGEVALTDEMVEDDWSINVVQNLSLLPGWHEVRVSVWGREFLSGGGYSEEPTMAGSLVKGFLVLAEVNDINPWMVLTANDIIVPRGVTATVELDEPIYFGWIEFDSIRVWAWEGSELDMLGEGLFVTYPIKFIVPSDLSIRLHGGRFVYLEISENDWSDEEVIQRGPISISNVSVGTLGVNGIGRDIQLSDVRVNEYLGVNTDLNSTVDISRVVLDNAYGNVNMWNGSLSISECTLRSNWSQYLYLQPSGADVDIRDCTFNGASLLVFFDNWYSWALKNINVTGCTFSGEESILYMGWDILHVDSYDVDPDFVPQMNGTIANNTFRGPGTAVVLHHGTFGQLWDVNGLSVGTRLYAFYITRLQVIPPDGTPFWGAYDFVPTGEIVTDWPFDVFRWIELDGEVMYDVTDDISLELHPPTLDILLYSKYGSSRIVRGFGHVVPNADNDEATFPIFPDLYNLLRGNVSYWPPLDDIP